jgi:hypothetical protein
MPDVRRYTETLRCRTWHSWPEKTLFGSKGFQLKLADGVVAIAGVAVATYLARSVAHDYTPERAELGPIVWRGEIPGVYIVHETVMKAPEDTIPITCEHEPPRKGEVDILVAVDLAEELPRDARDVLKSIAFAFLSLLNLRLGDYLTPCAPLQVSRRLPAGREFKNSFQFLVEKRIELSADVIESVSSEFFNLVGQGSASAKLQTALELYGAHISEASAKTRFLLLVMAIEALTVATPKHPAALALLDKWQVELRAERERLEMAAPEGAALDALERELLFRRDESIRSQVRQLLARVAASDPAHLEDLPKRGLRVYDKRSVLVHEGALPASELVELEVEARQIAQAALLYSLTRASGTEPG